MMKPYCSDFVIKLKILQTSGKLVGIHAPKPKEAKTSLVSPDTHEPVKQFYLPESKVGQDITAADLLVKSDCETAVVVKDQLTDKTEVSVLPQNVIQEIKESALPKNIMNLTIHDTEAADAVMYPVKDGQSYVFYPDTKDPDNVRNYQLLVEVVKKSNLAFCSVVNLQNHEGLFRLNVWRDRLIVVKQGFPDTINPHESGNEAYDVHIPQSFVDKAIEKFTNYVEPIEADSYKDRILSSMVNLKNAVDNGEVFEVESTETKDSSSLDDLLDAFDD